MKKNWKRLLSLLLSVCMMTGMFLNGSVLVSAEGVADPPDDLFITMKQTIIPTTIDSRRLYLNLTSIDLSLSENIYGVDSACKYIVGVDIAAPANTNGASIEIIKEDRYSKWFWSVRESYDGLVAALNVPVYVTQGTADTDFTVTPTLTWMGTDGEKHTKSYPNAKVTVKVPKYDPLITGMKVDKPYVVNNDTSIVFALTSDVDMANDYAYDINYQDSYSQVLGITPSQYSTDVITLYEVSKWKFDREAKTITVPVTVKQTEREQSVSFTPTVTHQGRTTTFKEAAVTVKVKAKPPTTELTGVTLENNEGSAAESIAAEGEEVKVIVTGSNLKPTDIVLTCDDPSIKPAVYQEELSTEGTKLVYLVTVGKVPTAKDRPLTFTAALKDKKETAKITQKGGTGVLTENAFLQKFFLDAAGGKVSLTLHGEYLSDDIFKTLSITVASPDNEELAEQIVLSNSTVSKDGTKIVYKDVPIPANATENPICYEFSASISDVEGSTVFASVTVATKDNPVPAYIYTVTPDTSSNTIEQAGNTTEYNMTPNGGNIQVVVSGTITEANYQTVGLKCDHETVKIVSSKFDNGTVIFNVTIPAYTKDNGDISYAFQALLDGTEPEEDPQLQTAFTVKQTAPAKTSVSDPTVTTAENGKMTAKVIIDDTTAKAIAGATAANPVKVEVPVTASATEAIKNIPANVTTAEISMALPSVFKDPSVIPSITVNKDVFTAAKENGNIDLAIAVSIEDGTSYTWTFGQGQIPANDNIDLAIQTPSEPDLTIQDDDAFKDATDGNADQSLQLNFPENGEFKDVNGKTVTVNVDVSVPDLGDKLDLYYWNGSELKKEASGLEPSNGTVSLPLTHNSSFVLLPYTKSGDNTSSSGGSTSSSGNTKSIVVAPGAPAVPQGGTGALLLDTKSYTMAPGGMYDIKALLTGANPADMKVYSSRDGIATVTLLPNGNYRITGVAPGTTHIIFDVYRNGVVVNHASVRVDVATGAVAHGEKNIVASIF